MGGGENIDPKRKVSKGLDFTSQSGDVDLIY